jgi:DNA-binding NtrC family response regulator
VRELENTMARACALASSQILLPADIPLASAPEKSPVLTQSLDHIINSAPADTPMLEWFSKQLVGRLLDRTGGDLKDAAALLGIELAEMKRILSK